MNTKKYRIADVSFEMSCQYDFTTHMCMDYEIEFDDVTQFYIEVSDEEILREDSMDEGIHSSSYLESLALYRKLCEKMLDYDSFLFHCSAVEVEGRAYLFAAPSGTGKSTHTRLWREHFGDKAVMINDDKPLLQVREDAIYVCGTPWCGKHGLNTNKKVPIQGICILARGMENKIERISPVEAYPDLYKQTYRPKDRAKMIKTLALLKELAERIPMYKMFCTISEEAAVVAWNGMRPQNDERCEE